MPNGSYSPPGPRSPTGCSSSANATCTASWPSSKPTTTDGDPTAAASPAHPGLITPPPPPRRSRASSPCMSVPAPTTGPILSGNVSLKRPGCSLEDWPADLRAPCGAVVGVAGPGVVDLTHGSCNLEGLLAHVGAESRVGDVDVVVRAGVDRGGQVDGRDDEWCHRPAAGGIGDRDVGHHGASFLGEQSVVV